MHTRKRNNKYQAEVWFHDGSRKSRSFQTRSEAQKWARQEESKRDSNKTYGTQRKITLNAYFEEWFDSYAKIYHSEGWQLSDKQMYRDYVAPLLGNRYLSEIHSLDIRKVLRKGEERGRKPSTLNRVRQLLHKMMEEAVKTHGYIGVNPVSAIRPMKEIPKAIEVLSKDELQKLLDWADTHTFGLAIHIAANTGMRQCEIVGLKWDRVDLDSGIITVSRQWDKKVKILREYTKGRDIRFVGISNQRFKDKLKDQKLCFPSSEFVVCNRESGMATPIQLTHALTEGIRKTEIKRIPFHGLRHTYASHYMESGGGAYDLQGILGHKSIETTQGYLHMNSEYLIEKSKVVNPYSGSTPANSK